MTNGGHKLSGLAVGLAAAALLYSRIGAAAFLVVAGALVGGTAPDRMEWAGRGRWCEHRTLTHWWPWWVALTAWSWLHVAQVWPVALLGLGLGAISHLLLDWPNPTGIPLLHPWARHSLRWWRSGEHEVFILLALFAVAFVAWTPMLPLLPDLRR